LIFEATPAKRAARAFVLAAAAFAEAGRQQ